MWDLEVLVHFFDDLALGKVLDSVRALFAEKAMVSLLESVMCMPSIEEERNKC